MKPWDEYSFGVPAEPVYCEICETEINPKQDDDYCEACYTEHFCECGQRLEDAYGSPGDGLCRKCD